MYDILLLLSNLRLEVGPEWHTVMGGESAWSSNVEIVLEVFDMEHHGIALARHTKQLDGRTAAMEGAFLGLDLLEAQIVCGSAIALG